MTERNLTDPNLGAPLGEAPGGEAAFGRRGRRALLLGVLAAGGALAGCGRKPGTLLPPGGEEDADGFPARYPSS